MYLEKLKRPVISNGESNTLKLKLIVNLFISLSFEDEPIDLCSISTKEVLWTLLNKKMQLISISTFEPWSLHTRGRVLKYKQCYVTTHVASMAAPASY